MAEVEAQRPTFTASLSAGEKDWPWKMGMRSALLIFDIIGIGSIAWILQYVSHSDRLGLLNDTWAMPWGLITLPLSFTWCFIVILVLISRKRPVHPGCVIGIDLVLWLALIVTGLFAIASAWSTIYFGNDGEINDYWSTGSGSYILQNNGTWVWQSSPRYSSYYGDDDNSRNCVGYYFDNCAEQDAYVNRIWQDKGRVTAAELLAVIAQWIAVILHLTLFIWGCVDVHRRRAMKTTNQAQLIAEKIIQDMTARGQIMPVQNMTQPLLAPTSSGAMRNGSSSTIGQQTPVAMPQPAFHPQQQHPYQQPLAPAPARSISPVSPVAEESVRHDPDAIEVAPKHPHAL